MSSKLENYWKKNRGIIIHIVRILFLLLTIAFLVVAIFYLILGDPVYGIIYFVAAVVSGSFTFALFRIGGFGGSSTLV